MSQKTHSISGPTRDFKGKAIATTFTASGLYEDLLEVVVGDASNKRVRVRGTTSGAALTGLKIRTKVSEAGQERDYFVDSDLDAVSLALPYTSKTSSGPSLYLTPAGGIFEFLLDATGMASFSIHAKSAGAGAITFEVNNN